MPLRGIEAGPNFVAILRSERDGAFTRAGCEFLRPLVPHIHQAVSIHRQLSEIQDKSLATADVLDQLFVGVLLLTSDNRIVYMNHEAETIIAEDDGITVDANGTCNAASSLETQKLHHLISNSVNTRLQQGHEPPGTVSISRPSSKRSYIVTVSPINLDRMLIAQQHVTVAIFILNPERRFEVSAKTMASLYDLTLSETRLVNSLANGISLSEYSAKTGISVHTVRSTLKHVMSKTETNRQAELVRLLLVSQGRE